MARLIVRRAGFSLGVLWGVTLVTFFLSRVVPGDPAQLIAGPRASGATIANIRHAYGLDRPLPTQYVDYMGRLLHGDLGQSFSTRRAVTTDLATFVPATIELALYALALALVLGVVIGVVAALRRGSAADVGARFGAIASLSLPPFWIAMLFQLWFHSHLGWLPFGGRLDTGAAPPPHLTGLYTVDALLTGHWSTLVDALTHLVLPAVTLALGVLGVMARIVRTSMLEVLDEDYIRTAEAKGLSRLRVLLRHSLRNALLPAVTVLGLELGLLAGGAFLVETIFAWPGIGRYAYTAIVSSDYNAIMGVTIAIAAVYVAANLLVDLAYLVLDPRIRYT